MRERGMRRALRGRGSLAGEGVRHALRGCDCGARHASLHRESDPREDATIRMRKGGATQEVLE